MVSGAAATEKNAILIDHTCKVQEFFAMIFSYGERHTYFLASFSVIRKRSHGILVYFSSIKVCLDNAFLDNEPGHCKLASANQIALT